MNASTTNATIPVRGVLGVRVVVGLVAAAAVILPLNTPADAMPVNNTAPAATLSTASAQVGFTAAKADGSKLSRAAYGSRLHMWANRVRRAHDVRPIRVRPCHERTAQRWAGYLARNDVFYHQDLGRYMRRCNLTKAGEILALGAVTPHRMIRMWLHSPHHRRILLDGSFGLSGIAARRDADGNWIGCIDFGRR